jgi:gas vesicle protein
MKDTLDALQARIPTAPEALLGAWQHTEHVETTAHHLTDTLTQLQEQCAHSTATLAAALTELRTAAATTVPQHLATRIAGLGQRLEALHASVNAGQAMLATASQRLQEKVATVQERLQQGQERLQQAAAHAHQAVGATQEKIHAAEQQALTAFGVAQEAVTTFQAYVDQASTETAAQVATLNQEVQQAQNTVTGKVQAAVASGFSPPQEAFGRHLEQMHHELMSAPVQQLVSQTQTAVEQQLQHIIDDAVLSQFSKIVHDIEQQLQQAGHSSALERQLLEHLMPELERAWGPVKDAADHVQHVAASVGISL